MSSKMKGHIDLPDEILLDILEHMDTATRESFMATNKSIRMLAQTYERSISKNHAVTYYTPNPPGDILCSATPKRRLLEKHTFAWVDELERREFRIESILKECSGLFASRSLWPPPLKAPEPARLESMLKKALRQCDQISDMAVEKLCPAIPKVYDGLVMKPIASVDHPAECHSFSNLCIRPRQIGYIQSLPLEDIAGLFLLTEMLRWGLQNWRESLINWREPQAQDLLMWTEESTLRHGTWFLWSATLGVKDMQVMASDMLRAGMVELYLWQAGHPRMQTGLKSTVFRCFNELVGGVPGSPIRHHQMTEEIVKLLTSPIDLPSTNNELAQSRQVDPSNNLDDGVLGETEVTPSQGLPQQHPSGGDNNQSADTSSQCQACDQQQPVEDKAGPSKAVPQSPPGQK